MESRKIVLMIGQQRRNRHTKQTMDMEGEEEGEGETCGENNMETYTTIYKNRQPMGILCMTQGTQRLCKDLGGVGGKGDGKEA